MCGPKYGEPRLYNNRETETITKHLKNANVITGKPITF